MCFSYTKKGENEMENVIEAIGVTKQYGEREAMTLAVDHIDFTIGREQLSVILGPSGAGKSTILNVLGGLDHVSEGRILVDGVDITDLNEQKLAAYRASKIGFVFQFYNLIPTLTAYENVALIKEVSGAILDVEEVLDAVGLKAHMHKFPSQLSGGEQQRVSIARAIVKNPALLLCDEPTGALDSETGCTILELLWNMVRVHHRSVIIVTHNTAVAQMADRVLHMKNGKLDFIEEHAHPLSVNEVKW